MLYEVQTKKKLEEIDQALRDSAARHKFGVLTVHDLKETMKNKGVEFGKTVRIYEVCNPHQAKRVLEANPAISTALPCRISVYECEEGYRLATLLPTALMGMFGEASLKPVAEEVEATLKAMMSEST